MTFHRRTLAEIDLSALARNVRVIREGVGDSFLCPMVKANGYGHGDVGIAKALAANGIQHLGVCLVEEGLALREGGVGGDVLVFLASDEPALREALAAKLTPVLSTWEQVEILEKIAAAPVDVHVKFDTGMNRLGFSVRDAQKVFDRMNGNAKFRVRGVLTHLFRGEDADQSGGDSAQQIQLIRKIGEIFRPLVANVHALNSAGLVHRMAGSKICAGIGARPGLMVYGFNPVRPGYGCELEPVMTLRSEAEVYRKVNVGETVSYNGTWQAQRDSVIAVVPIGYADGYHRVLSNKGIVLFEGERVPVVGTVCMDYLMIDLTDFARDKKIPPRGEVVLFGKSKTGSRLGADEVARLAGTITWEILTSVGPRLPRQYISGESA